MTGKSVAQIMDARPLASAGVPDLASQQQLPEYCIHPSKTQRAAGGRREDKPFADGDFPARLDEGAPEIAARRWMWFAVSHPFR